VKHQPAPGTAILIANTKRNNWTDRSAMFIDYNDVVIIALTNSRNFGWDRELQNEPNLSNLITAVNFVAAGPL
jgi:hypothetical protein